ncbi:MAG TPA: GAF domain-containing protein [Nostocaceae cyanobacterium]|nr:GAF domain-containing protein [Nostocaceae cyanobacterium]
MSLLVNNAQEAGRIYKVSGSIRAEMLRAEIYRAWERSHLQGANPRALQADHLSQLETERLLEQHNYLIQAVRPYCRYLSQAAGSEPHAVMLSDRHAILLDVVGDEKTVHNLDSFPKPGSLLSEAVAGANGVGTPLAEEKYVEIVNTEHFIEGFHPFTCQGIPLYNSKKEIIGVLSISLQHPDARQRLKEILLCASRAVEAELLVKVLEADIRQVLVASPEDYQPLEQLRQDIIQAHQTARFKLEIISRMVAVNRLEYATQLLQQAEKFIKIFSQRAHVWQSLASLESSTVQSISLTDSISDLVDLLSTEASINKLEVKTYWLKPITIQIEPKSFLRHLLRYFLQAFERAGKGGRLKIAVTNLPNSKFIEINFTSIPGLNSPQLKPSSQIFSLPKK